jgi:hypothetical protein
MEQVPPLIFYDVYKTGPFFKSAIRNARQKSQLSLGEVVTGVVSSREQGNVDKGIAHFFHLTRFVFTPPPLQKSLPYSN